MRGTYTFTFVLVKEIPTALAYDVLYECLLCYRIRAQWVEGLYLYFVFLLAWDLTYKLWVSYELIDLRYDTRLTGSRWADEYDKEIRV